MNTTPKLHSALNFDINSRAAVSQAFIKKGILNFEKAAAFIMALPYRRNKDKNNLLTVFTDNCGTCSTKHALLKQLAMENNFNNLRLMLGIFKMNAENTPEVKQTLAQHNLDYIPEAHNYLKYQNQILDFTKPDFKLSINQKDLLFEIEIEPHQITDFKVAFHKNYLKKWLNSNTLQLSPEELLLIKEQCIANLSGIHS